MKNNEISKSKNFATKNCLYTGIKDLFPIKDDYFFYTREYNRVLETIRVTK